MNTILHRSADKRQKSSKPKAALSLAVIFSMLFSLFACQTNAPDNNNTGVTEAIDSNAGENGGTTVEETTEVTSPIPADVQFDGEEIRILNCSYFVEDSVYVNAEESIGEIVNDAIYNRNIKVQSDLNVNFNITDISIAGGGNFSQLVTNSVLAGSDDYDILIGVQYDCVQLATQNVFANLVNVPYLDLEQPWWPTNYINEMSIGKDTLYFLTGDISLNSIRNMSCAYFNKKVYQDNFGDPDEMYKLVLDGKWTLDALSEMGKVMYKDLNGNGEYDDDDQYAYGVMTMNLTDHFTYDAGVRVTERDENGMPYFVMNNERTILFVEKINDIFFNNPGGRVFPSTDTTNKVTIPGKFMKDELLFDFGWFFVSELLRDMKSDYGIIPFPKLDESQPTYLSLAHDIGPVFCIPLTCEKLEAAGAVLEAMAFESYRTVLPAYFEIALKLKYIRDTNEDAFTIVDMIHENATTDFAYIYNYALNNIGLIMRDLLAAKSTDFVSRYSRIEVRIQMALDKLIDIYTQGAE